MGPPGKLIQRRGKLDTRYTPVRGADGAVPTSCIYKKRGCLASRVAPRKTRGSRSYTQAEEEEGFEVRRSIEASSEERHGSGAAAAFVVGEDGAAPACGVRGDVGGGGAAAGVQRADQDRALRPEEGRPQGRAGPLVRTHSISSLLITSLARSPEHVAVTCRSCLCLPSLPGC